MDDERLIDKLNSRDVIKYVISATLSSFEEDTWFYTRKDGDLKDKLTEIYLKSKHELLKKHLFGGFTSPFNNHISESRRLSDRNEVRNNLSVWTEYGRHIGLSNGGFNYDFRIGRYENCNEIRKRMIEEAKGILGEEDFNYFRELGERLKD